MQYISQTQPIDKQALVPLAEKMFGGLVKGVVDIHRGIMAIDAEMHVDLEQVLLENGSHQEHLWGINLYPQEEGEDFLEFDSMINIRPSQGNKTRGVESEVIQGRIRDIITHSISV
jgi:hypothetical protein